MKLQCCGAAAGCVLLPLAGSVALLAGFVKAGVSIHCRVNDGDR